MIASFQLAFDLLRNTAVIGFGMLSFEYVQQRTLARRLPHAVEVACNSVIVISIGIICMMNPIFLPGHVRVDLLIPLAILATVFGGIMTGTQLISIGLVLTGGLIWWLRPGLKTAAQAAR